MPVSKLNFVNLESSYMRIYAPHLTDLYRLNIFLTIFFYSLIHLLTTAVPALPLKPLSSIVLSHTDVVGALQFVKQCLCEAGSLAGVRVPHLSPLFPPPFVAVH